MLPWQRRHAYVDFAVACLNREPTVQRQTTLGNIEISHQLEPLRQRGSDAHIGLGLLLEHTIDAKADLQRSFLRLDMDIRGTHLHCIFKQRLQQSHHWRVFLAARRSRHAFGRHADIFFERTRMPGNFVCTSIKTIQHGENLVLCTHGRRNRTHQDALGSVQRAYVAGISESNEQTAALIFEHHCTASSRGGFRQQLDKFRSKFVFSEIHERNIELFGQQHCQFVFTDSAALYEHPSKPFARICAGGKRCDERLCGNEPLAHQQFANTCSYSATAAADWIILRCGLHSRQLLDGQSLG